MTGNEKLRRAFLRWDHLLVVFVLGLPFGLLILLGFLWLLQHNAILWFLAASLLISAAVLLLRHILRRRWRTEAESDAGAADLSVEPDPDWLPSEKAVFADVGQHISALTRTALPWEDLPEHALAVVNKVAAGLDGKNKSALAFTLPEALLLLESTASRYREHLRSKLPFSDQVSLATLYWLWRQRNRANVLWKVAQGSSRVARFAFNPAAGILRELEQIVSGGNSGYVTENMMGVMQAVLLEEVAYAAIELYSGRLRFSDRELMQIQLSTSKADDERMALPDMPVRVLFLGQTSAGKSTLINALLATDRAETDAAATTPDLVTYPVELDGIACHFLDSEGLDGANRNFDRMLKEMTQADLVVWAIRGNRPARELDVRLQQRFDAWFESHPRRRKPGVLVVVTAMDQLVAAQGQPSAAQQATIAAAVTAIGKDMAGLPVLPVSLGPVPWNLDKVNDALCAELPEAKRVQRNRRRVEGASRESRFGSQLRKGGRGIKQGLVMAGSRITKGNGGTENQSTKNQSTKNQSTKNQGKGNDS
ncbi:MAG: GTPase [Pseudohongiella sp.]